MEGNGGFDAINHKLLQGALHPNNLTNQKFMSNPTSVPFVDLHAQYLSIKSEIDAVIEDVIKTSAFIRGPYVQKFEEMFASMMEREYCVSCANGTDR